MADLDGVDIQKAETGANTIGDADSISGLIVGAIAPAGLAHDVTKKVYNLKDVEALGITTDFDADNDLNAHRHCKEFFRMAGEGTELYLQFVDPATSMSDICEHKAKTLLATAKGKVKQIAVAKNIALSSAITMLNGIPKDVHDAIAKAQGLALWAYNNHMPCHVFLEGYAYGGNAAASDNLRALANLSATKVSVFIGQDYKYADTLTGHRQKFADVGTLLGICALAKVNQNVGNNEEFDLTDIVKDAWLVPGLSSHTENDQVLEDLQTLEDKGYLFGVEYVGMSGVRINGDHVCAPIVLDAQGNINEHTISLGRVIDKAVRRLRVAYLPKVKTDWVLTTAGKIPPGVVIALEDLGDKEFEKMKSRGEISSGKTYVDKDSDLIVAKSLGVEYVIIPKGSIGEIKGKIQLKITL